MRIIANILLVSSFSIALYPSYRYANFMSFKKSNVMVIFIGRFTVQLASERYPEQVCAAPHRECLVPRSRNVH